MNIRSFLEALVKNKGSDLHISSLSQPRLRIHGEMIAANIPKLEPAQVESLINSMITAEQKLELTREKSLDFAHIEQGIGIFRVNIFYQRHGPAFVMRHLSEAPPTLEQLNPPAICERACRYRNGLILVTGPTGSGKSTTLAAMLNHINDNTHGHILTLEDPIEFRHKNKKCLVSQRALGDHFQDFSSALEASVRENPSVILVGEMRDPETMALAIKAAETGVLVFSTLHTNSASKSVDRVVNSFPADEQEMIRIALSENLRMIIAQKLVKRADRKGRIAYHDILVNTSGVAALIREGKTSQITNAMQTGKAAGMQLVDRVMLEGVNKGEITGRDAWEIANDKSMFSRYAPGTKKAASSKPPQGGGAPPAPGRPPGIPSAA